MPNAGSTTSLTPDGSVFYHHFASNSESVRGAIEAALAVLETFNPSDDQRAASEIVLAETINNIVEHAYQNVRDRPIELALEKHCKYARFKFVDVGFPMPHRNIPHSSPKNLSCHTLDLPEGGFGWLLIRELTSDISYLRKGRENHLSFTLSFGKSSQGNVLPG